MRFNVEAFAVIVAGLCVPVWLAWFAEQGRYWKGLRKLVEDRLVSEGLTPTVCHRTVMPDLYVDADPLPERHGPLYRIIAHDAKGRERQGFARVEIPGWSRFSAPPLVEPTGRVDFFWQGDGQPAVPNNPPPKPARAIWDADLDGPARR